MGAATAAGLAIGATAPATGGMSLAGVAPAAAIMVAMDKTEKKVLKHMTSRLESSSEDTAVSSDNAHVEYM